MISSTLISDLRSTTKVKEKLNILKDNDCEFFRFLLKSTYEPFINYHADIKLKEIKVTGNKNVNDLEEEIRDVIKICSESKSPKKNRAVLLPLLSMLDKDNRDLVLGVINKNWKAGISTKTINKVYKGLITQFCVQLSNSYNKSSLKKSYKPKDRYCSYKLDGVRCVFLRLDGVWKAISRQGERISYC